MRTVYVSLIQSVYTYCSALFIKLPDKSEKMLNSIRRRAHNIICYKNCHCPLLPKPLEVRRTRAINLFLKAESNKFNRLHTIVPSRMAHSGKLQQPPAQTERRLRSFLPQIVQHVNQDIENFL